MLKVGDQVWVKTKKCRGTVDLVEGNYIIVKLSNGVELDCRPIMLEKYIDQDTKAFMRASVNGREEDPQASELLELIRRDFPELLSIGIATHTRTTAAVTKLGGHSVPWNKLNANQRLNFIGIALQLPPANLLDTYRNKKQPFKQWLEQYLERLAK